MKISFVHNNIKFNKAFPGILIYFTFFFIYLNIT